MLAPKSVVSRAILWGCFANALQTDLVVRLCCREPLATEHRKSVERLALVGSVYYDGVPE